MSGEIPSGWIPDKLPEFRNRKIPVTVNDFQLTAEIIWLSQSLRVKPTELAKRIIKLGLIAVNIEKDPNSTLVERDDMGKETKVYLMDQEYSDEDQNTQSVQFGPLSIRISRKLVARMPGALGDEFMELANRYHTTVDNVLRKMFILGIKVGKAQNDPNKSYIIQSKNSHDEEMLLF